MSFLLPLIVSSAQAESALEFRTTSPVALVVDGQQASITSNMRQRLGGLDAGVHQLQVNGVFGKTLYEAEIDLPDNTLTTAEWVRGELRVVKTEWLDEAAPEEVVEDAPAEAAPEVVEVEAPVTPVPEEVPEVVAAPVAVPPVASAPVPSVPVAVPTEAPVARAVPAPVAASAMPAAVRPRTLSVQATDGMRIDVVYQGRTLSVVVDGDTFRIEDPTGAVLALGSN